MTCLLVKYFEYRILIRFKHLNLYKIIKLITENINNTNYKNQIKLKLYHS